MMINQQSTCLLYAFKMLTMQPFGGFLEEMMPAFIMCNLLSLFIFNLLCKWTNETLENKSEIQSEKSQKVSPSSVNELLYLCDYDDVTLIASSLFSSFTCEALKSTISTSCSKQPRALDAQVGPIILIVLFQRWVSNNPAACIMFQCKPVKAGVFRVHVGVFWTSHIWFRDYVKIEVKI